MTRPLIISLFLLFCILLVSCSESDEKFCNFDEDCVKSTCCHPRDAVNEKYGPECAGVFCSQQCEPGTIDCGQGEINCVRNRCTVLLT
jgi:hypothetical protein